MKIRGKVIQNRMIREYTKDVFDASYKNREIYITTDHGHGEPEDEELNRYDITVRAFEGMYDVDTWEDFSTIEEAIHFALEGAMLL